MPAHDSQVGVVKGQYGEACTTQVEVLNNSNSCGTTQRVVAAAVAVAARVVAACQAAAVVAGMAAAVAAAGVLVVAAGVLVGDPPLRSPTWSAAFLSPLPSQRPPASAAASVTRTSSTARFRCTEV